MSQEALLSKLGFRFGENGPHAARTMMLEDIGHLLEGVAATAQREAYAREVIDNNCLGKPTKKARELAFRHLSVLYGLDPGLAIFRAFRRLWDIDEASRPVLALCMALARDPLLRASEKFMVSKGPGKPVSREEVEKLLASAYNGRFSAASLKSFAQNINGTWTQAGFLRGHTRKMRAAPVPTPANVAFCLFLTYLTGLSGQRLFVSDWANLLGARQDELESLAGSASQRELLVFMNAGGVKEVRFPEYLTAEEELWRQEALNDI